MSRLLRATFMVTVAAAALMPSFGSWQDQLFRSEVHGFRVKFPAGWKVSKGDGPHIVQKAVRGGATILVQVNVVPPEYSKSKFSITEVFTAQDYIEGLRSKYPDARLVTSRKTKLDNEDALYGESVLTSESDGIKVTLQSMVYLLYENGKLYQVSAMVAKSEFESLRQTFRKCLLTFVLEA